MLTLPVLALFARNEQLVDVSQIARQHLHAEVCQFFVVQ